MEELIRIKKTNQGEAVSARELYEFLGLNLAHWKRWYNKNIVKDDFFTDKVDYDTFTIMVNGNKTLDFAITMDMAKELAMMSRSKKGRVARRYFIACEKQLKSYNSLNHIEKEGIKRLNQVEGTKGVKEYLCKRFGPSKGVQIFIWWSKESHKEITGRSTKETKKLGIELGLKSKDRVSAKEIVRSIEPQNAFGLYVSDIAVQGGAGSALAINIGKAASKNLALKAPDIHTDKTLKPF